MFEIQISQQTYAHANNTQFQRKMPMSLRPPEKLMKRIFKTKQCNYNKQGKTNQNALDCVKEKETGTTYKRQKTKS